MIYFLYPFGLLALASLGAVLFIYFHVFRGRRIPVSALFLWNEGQSLRTEGRRRKRPPVTWPLLLELLAALLLSLLVGGLVYSRRAERKHLAVVLDSSASMNAGSRTDGFRARARATLADLYDLLGKDGRISLVQSGAGGSLAGGQPLAADEADTFMADWEPGDPPHSFRPAVELARSFTKAETKPVLLTDRPVEMEGVVTLSIGRPLDNTAWVAANWTGPHKLFALVRYFGEEMPMKEIVLSAQGKELTRTTVDFAQRNPVPLVFDVPESVRSVRAVLPDDALSNDNELRITRPQPLAIRARLDVKHDLLHRHLLRAIGATDKAIVSESPEPALVFVRQAPPEAAPGPFTVRFHVMAKDKARPYVGPFFAEPFHPLLRGVELQGAIWAADPDFPAGAEQVLVSAADIPLVTARETGLTINLVPERSNLFRTAAWPVLVSNIVDAVYERSPGLKRFSYRLGESLSFRKPPEWRGPVEVRSPRGGSVTFTEDHIYYGRLEHGGIYEVRNEGRTVATVDVNLLAEGESDLTGAEPGGDLADVRAALLPGEEPRPFHREFFAAASALLLGTWFFLERQRR
jgi:hypothetical protein